MDKTHLIIDFMYLYYKYRVMYVKGRLPELTTNVDGVERNISIPYFVLSEIEKLIPTFTSKTGNIAVSICFDSPNTDRKDEDGEYKANRESRLEDSDFENIKLIHDTLEKIGYNVYMKEKTEADDLVYSLVQTEKDKFDYTVICTPDLDEVINICNKVGVYRYKSTNGRIEKGYKAISEENYENYCSIELQADLRYNAILLYKSIVGDKSDNIKGVKGMGAVAYNSIVNTLDGKIDWKELAKPEEVEKVLKVVLGDDPNKYEQAIHSLEMAKPRIIEGLAEPKIGIDKEARNRVYNELSMQSLVNKA